MNKTEWKRIPELLVPAGGYQQLRAAVANGADAVYLSGSSFNARINADNFTEDSLQEAIHFAHEHGVRVHVTLNTLVREEEFEDAVRFAQRCKEYGADAFILQDRGLAAELMRRMPNAVFHLSTQGTVYDAAGAQEAYRAGFQRVILSRELSIGEIRHICRACQGEIEIFVHGAICIAYSGQCHMSYAIGGRSGNRGTCAQPCRLPYTLCKEDAPQSQRKSRHLLSPSDMCLIDHLQEIAEAGVCSLKIEGRMKSPEYVATVTRIYRKYLDLLACGEAQSISAEDWKELLSVFNRGGMTDSYYRGESGKRLMAHDVPKHQGVYIGRVIACDQKRSHITAELEEELSIGDGIEIRSGTETWGNVVTYLNDRGSILKSASAGQSVTVGDLSGKIPSGAPVFKVTDKALMKKAAESYRKIPPFLPVDMTLTVEEGRPANLEVSSRLWRRQNPVSVNGAVVSEEPDAPPISVNAAVVSDTPLQRADKRLADEAAIRKQLEKTGGTPYYLDKLEVYITGMPMIPASLLNALRRDALSLLTQRRLQAMLFHESERQYGGRHAGSMESDPADRLPVSVGENSTEPSETLYSEIRIREKSHENGAAKDPRLRQAEGKESKFTGSRISLYFYDTEENGSKIAAVLERMKKMELMKLDATPVFDFFIPYRKFLQNAEWYIRGAEDLSCRLRSQRMTSDDEQIRPVNLIPYLPAIIKGFDEKKLQQDAARLSEFCRSGGVSAVSVANGGHISLFQKENGKNSRFAFPLWADENLHLFNLHAVSELTSKGIYRGVWSHELSDEDILRMLSSLSSESSAYGFFSEVTVYGRIPVMHTEHCVVGAASRRNKECSTREKRYYCRDGSYVLCDRKGETFPILTDCSVCRMELLSHRPQDRRDLFKRIRKRLPQCSAAARICIFDETEEEILQLIESILGVNVQRRRERRKK